MLNREIMKRNSLAGTNEASLTRYNAIAMQALRNGEFTDSLLLLRKAESLLNTKEGAQLQNKLQLMGETLNNLGQYFSKRKQPKTALHYLESALKFKIQDQGEVLDIANTHLAISSQFSALGNHRQAFVHATKAATLLEDEVHSDMARSTYSVSLATSLVKSYFSAACEKELLGSLSKALTFYDKACSFSESFLGRQHPVTASMLESLKKFEQKHGRGLIRINPYYAQSPEKERRGRRLPTVTPRARADKSFDNYRVSTSHPRSYRLA
jgi:tetratricopeptide (TPR) repeat protein